MIIRKKDGYTLVLTIVATLVLISLASLLITLSLHSNSLVNNYESQFNERVRIMQIGEDFVNSNYNDFINYYANEKGFSAISANTFKNSIIELSVSNDEQNRQLKVKLRDKIRLTIIYDNVALKIIKYNYEV